MKTKPSIFILAALVVAGSGVLANQGPGSPESLRLAKFVAPEYLAFARQGALEGIVHSRLRADSTGRVTKIEMLDGNIYLQDLVMHAVEQWQFYPCASGGCEAVFSFRFKLEGERTSFWTPTRISFAPPYSVEIITNPPEPIRDTIIKKDR